MAAHGRRGGPRACRRSSSKGHTILARPGSEDGAGTPNPPRKVVLDVVRYPPVLLGGRRSGEYAASVSRWLASGPALGSHRSMLLGGAQPPYQRASGRSRPTDFLRRKLLDEPRFTSGRWVTGLQTSRMLLWRGEAGTKTNQDSLLPKVTV